METRAARKDDSVVLAALLRELAEQQGKASMLALKKDGTDAIISVGNNGSLVLALTKDGFELLQCVIAEVDSQQQGNREIVGCAIYGHMYSTWEGRVMLIPVIHVRPGANREQIQEALIRKCAEVAVSTHCTRMQLEIQREDTASISWYSNLGVEVLHEWIPVWFSIPALSSFIAAEEDLEREVKSKFLIRPAQKTDAQSILYLIQVLAEYEKEPFALKITEHELLRDGFGRQAFYYCFVAVAPSSPDTSPQPHCQEEEASQPSDAMPHDKHIVSYALYMLTYSPLEGRVLHLEDLFVLSQYRGQGLGTTMLRECAKVARDKNCARMQLSVLDWNTRARDLYVRIGGECHSEIVTVRFRGDTLKALGTATQHE